MGRGGHVLAAPSLLLGRWARRLTAAPPRPPGRAPVTGAVGVVLPSQQVNPRGRPCPGHRPPTRPLPACPQLRPGRPCRAAHVLIALGRKQREGSDIRAVSCSPACGPHPHPGTMLFSGTLFQNDPWAHCPPQFPMCSLSPPFLLPTGTCGSCELCQAPRPLGSVPAVPGVGWGGGVGAPPVPTSSGCPLSPQPCTAQASGPPLSRRTCRLSIPTCCAQATLLRQPRAAPKEGWR